MLLVMAMKLAIAAFPEGGAIPAELTCDGANHSPAIEWSGAPDGTRSFALIMDDPDAPGGTWNHWLLFDIPAGVHAIAQAFRPGHLGRDGGNDFGKPGYGGPCPPKGHGPHRYYFRIVALDVPELPLNRGATRKEIERAMEGHVLGRAEYMGRYERK